MKLIRDPSYEAWDAFQTHVPHASFPQSWAWGAFRSASGMPVLRFALEGNEKHWLIAAQMEYRRRRFGIGYWFMPCGPVFSPRVPMEKRTRLLQRFLSDIHGAGVTDALFWRMEPSAGIKQPEGLLPRIAKAGRPFAFVRVPALNPSSTRRIDLAKPTDALRAEMHHKTRYNIRVAERKGVAVRVSRSPEDVERFLTLLAETASRREFTPQSAGYLRDMARMLSERDLLRLRIAEVNGGMRAGSMEIAYGDTVTYLHGASAGEERESMAPYALHWDAIVTAKREGFRWYDFWGENPPVPAMPDWKASWQGITRFKSGWGGAHVDLAGTWDLPQRPRLYALAFFPRRFKT